MTIAYKENDFHNFVRFEPTIVDHTVLRESESIAISSSKATVTWSESCHQRARHVWWEVPGVWEVMAFGPRADSVPLLDDFDAFRNDLRTLRNKVVEPGGQKEA